MTFVTLSPSGDSFSFNYVKYNRSLNKYLFFNSNLDVVLDDYDFYFSFYIKKFLILKKILV